MSYSMEGKLVIGISSGALFDRSMEEEIFRTQGVEAYCRYQRAHESEILKPGVGFELIRALLNLNGYSVSEPDCGEHKKPVQESDKRRVEVILMSRNSPDLSLRVYRSIEYYGLDIMRSVFVGGADLAAYFDVFGPDLFLSSNEEDVRRAIQLGLAAGVVKRTTSGHLMSSAAREQGLRLALDADAVIFGDESEAVFQEYGLEAFEAHERSLAGIPMSKGPFADFLKKLNWLQKKVHEEKTIDREGQQKSPEIRIAIITARSAPAHERVIRTLREWDMCVDEIFFLGGMSKKEAVKAFGPQIYFDDQRVHTDEVAMVAPTARVPGMVTDRRSKSKVYEIQGYRSGTFCGKTQPVYCIRGAG